MKTYQVECGEYIKSLGLRIGCAGTLRSEVHPYFMSIIGPEKTQEGWWIFKYRPRADVYGEISFYYKVWKIVAFGANGFSKMVEILPGLCEIATRHGNKVEGVTQISSHNRVETYLSDYGIG